MFYVGVLCSFSFWYALLYVLSRFAIILTRKRELAVLLLLSFGYLVTTHACGIPHGAIGGSAVCDCGIF